MFHVKNVSSTSLSIGGKGLAPGQIAEVSEITSTIAFLKDHGAISVTRQITSAKPKITETPKPSTIIKEPEVQASPKRSMRSRED
jgi:hypothetical protein